MLSRRSKRSGSPPSRVFSMDTKDWTDEAIDSKTLASAILKSVTLSMAPSSLWERCLGCPYFLCRACRAVVWSHAQTPWQAAALPKQHLVFMLLTEVEVASPPTPPQHAVQCKQSHPLDHSGTPGRGEGFQGRKLTFHFMTMTMILLRQRQEFQNFQKFQDPPEIFFGGILRH